ncbi:MAG: hypothetical protein JRE57_00120 [Deltaproteobacteria bacterium]|nr:hypothetical protein [Deltaproteobacteria bacterium]
MARHGTGGRVETRLYMEGRLVKNAMVNVRVQGSVGQPSTAQLELVPTNTIKHILPFTWIHVFTTDPWDQNPAGDLSDYKLLFEGVVMSRGFTRTDSGRSFVIQCADPAIFWTNAKQFWLNIASANGDIVDQLAVQTSGGYGRFGKVTTTGSFGYMVNKLAFTRKESEQAEERFLDTMVAVLDDIGNVNPYYTNARNRFRITDRVVRGPAGNTEKLFQLALLSDFLDGLAGRSSGQSNLAQVINELLGAVLHEWVSVVAPPYIKTRIFDRDVFGNIRRTKKTVKGRGPRGRQKVDIYDFGMAEDHIVASVLFKPDVYTISPPACNVLFPNMYDQSSYSENFMAEPTRLSMRPQLPILNKRVRLTQGLLLQRPTELEVFTSVIRDPQRNTAKARTPDGKFADGESQTPNFNDYDWSTNEERIRGIVYNFMNLAPAPSTLTMTDPGRKQPSGTRKGGVPKYLQNVASYEYYKSKFAARTSGLGGPYNMRVIPGFPILALDDSDAELNLIASLDGVSHHIDASGSATTSYQISSPRLVDEVDYNRPRFKGGYTAEGELDVDLFRDENGQYDFRTIFDGENQPPVPEWFDESFRNVIDLDIRYNEWFGSGVVQKILFENPGEAPAAAAMEAAAEVFQTASGSLLSRNFASIGEALKVLESDESKAQFEEVLASQENIPLSDAVAELNKRYRMARSDGREFDQASSFTARTFTKIDEAFRFIGAAPLELSDNASEGGSGPQFTQQPAAARSIDYKQMRLDLFVGDTSAGSGYSGVSAGNTPTGAATDDELLTLAAEAAGEIATNRMAGAFPLFDTRIHTGAEATDETTRNALLKAGEIELSDRARYDGRPLMYDFEFRLWQESLSTAGFAPTDEEIIENGEVAGYKVSDDRGNIVTVKTPEEAATIALRRTEILEERAARADARKNRSRHDARPRKCPNMAPKDQAPTGDGLEQEEKKELPQPLSEKQVVDLRRAVIDAYREELERNRGFTG